MEDDKWEKKISLENFLMEEGILTKKIYHIFKDEGNF